MNADCISQLITPELLPYSNDIPLPNIKYLRSIKTNTSADNVDNFYLAAIFAYWERLILKDSISAFCKM